MNVLEPLRTQSSPSRTAVVFSAARSEPPDGSVIPIAVRISPVQKPGSQRLLLLLGGQVDEVRRHDVGVDAHARGQRHVDLGQLLGEHRVEAVVAGPGAAVLLGDLQAEEALLAGLDPEVPRDRLARRRAPRGAGATSRSRNSLTEARNASWSSS